MITVVVCTHNGAGKIRGTLEALSAQDRAAERVIIVDDGSRDNVGEVVGPYTTEHGFRYIRLDQNVGLSAARNIGIEHAESDIVAFCDDDCVPRRSWIAELERAWSQAESGRVGIGGSTTPYSTDTLARRYAEATVPLAPIELGTGGGIVRRLRTYLRGVNRSGEGRPVASLVGANMSYRREALQAVGGFDELIKFGGDEEKLCARLQESFGDQCLWFEPGIVMQHEYEHTLRDAFRRARAYGAGSGREWARTGGLPSLRPGIVAMIGVLLLAMVAGGLAPRMLRGAIGAWLVGWGLGPFLLAGHTVQGRRLEKYLYPHLTMALEGANLIGFVQGWRRWRKAPKPPQDGGGF